MKDFDNSMIGPILGQLVIIIGLIATACFAIAQLNKMPHTFYYIFINRWRHIFKSIIPSILKSIRQRKMIKPEYTPYNESYTWLMKNKIYINYLIFFWATIIMTAIQIIQFSNGEVFIKAKGSFVAGPIRSVTLIYILWALVEEIKRLKADNRILLLKLWKINYEMEKPNN